MTETTQQPQGVPAAAEESKKKRRWPLVLLGGSAALLIFAVATSGDTETDAGTAADDTTISAPANDVPWEDYAPEVRQRIDDLGASGDCEGLQAEFDVADANNDATMDRTGHNNADLMGYIDGWMEQAGCYAWRPDVSAS